MMLLGVRVIRLAMGWIRMVVDSRRARMLHVI